MSHVLKQIPINCPTCGEYLFRLFKESYDLTNKQILTEERDPLCKKCNLKDFFEALKHSTRSEFLTEIKSAQTAAKFGEKIVKKTKRKELTDVELFDPE